MSVIQALNLPKANLKLEKKGSEIFVWCVIRKKKLVFTPEEWVRQHVIHFFIHQLKIPIERIVSEYAIKVNAMNRRCDLVILNQLGEVQLIVECKATSVPINESVFHQIAHYNRTLQVDFLMLTNGLEHFIAEVNKTTGELILLDEFPIKQLITRS